MIRDSFQSLLKSESRFSIITNLSGIVIAVISLILTISAIPGAEISYEVRQVAIFDQESLTFSGVKPKMPFKLVDEAGWPIEDNIYVATVTIWNSGNVSLGQDKIRKPLEIRFLEDPHLVYFVFGITTEENVLGILGSFSPDQPNSIVFKWDFFDPGDHFVVHITYTEATQIDIQPSISASGVSDLTKSNNWKIPYLFMIITLAFLVLNSCNVLFLTFRTRKLTAKTKSIIPDMHKEEILKLFELDRELYENFLKLIITFIVFLFIVLLSMMIYLYIYIQELAVFFKYF